MTAAGPSKTLAELWQNSKAAITLPQILESAELFKDEAACSAWQGETAKIAVVGDLTLDLLAASIGYGAFQEGVLPQLYVAPYGSFVQEVIDPNAGLHRFAPDVVVLAPDWRQHIESLPITASQEEVDQELEATVARFQSLWDQLTANQPCRIIQHLFSPTGLNFRGLADRLSPASLDNQCAALNRMLIAAAGDRVQWVEIDSLAHAVGVTRWSSERHYQASRLPFDPAFLVDYVAYFRAAWRTGAAKGKKVLAVDLDNTLWGGVIGDDGVEGIKLGAGSPESEAFADWGRYVKALSARGIILAICSKNNPVLAATGFDHPHSPLALEDFAAVEISWDDKASGLRRLAAKLNVGLDSFVFVDDNPFECDLVRQNAPEVSVVELGTDPSAFIDILEKGRWFDLAGYTQEDIGRAKAYRARSAAESERASATDIDSYLRGLQMEAQTHEATASHLARLAQMEKKTNQFNLTTRRLSLEQLDVLRQSDDAILLAFDLKDRHADHGLVSSLVAMREDNTLRIDSWLMSCRVFSRSFEDYILNELITRAVDLGVEKIVGEYLPTAKNIVVADLFERLGFSRADDSGRYWELSLDDPAAVWRKTFIGLGDPAAEFAGAPVKAAPKAPPKPALSNLSDEQLIQAAQDASQAHDFGKAAAHWKEAVRRDPGNPDAFIFLAEAYRGLGQFENAGQTTSEGMRHHPEHPGVFFQYAATAESAQDWPEALARWQKALSRFPGYPEPRHGIGVAYLHLGKTSDAEFFFADNCQMFPKHVLSGMRYAEAASILGHWEAAAIRLRDLHARFPDDADIAVRLTVALVHSDEIAEAQSVIKAAEQKFPANALVLEHCAMVSERLNDWPAVLTQAEAALSLSGNHPRGVELAREARRRLGRQRGKTLVIYGNCQGSVLYGLANRMRGLYQDFDIAVILGHLPEEQAKLSDPILEDAVMLWEQYDERPSVPMRDELRERVGANCPRLVYPSLSMFSLWPFNWPDSRSHPEPPRFPHGRYPYDGDAVGIEVAQEGLRGQAAFDRYMEISRSRLHNLSGQFDRDVEQWRRRDSASDVKMAEYLLNTYRKERTFFTWGHVSGRAMQEVAVQLLAKSKGALGVDAAGWEDEVRSLRMGEDEFWMPIHPDVAAWHRLDYASNDQAVYNVYGNSWTFKEYITKYIEYDTSW
ncbi:WcbI family polysaccharide biosynthesis putative acetyltransferase [Novosphingobium panipatense]|uniref:WcbI family polysaccharide biosynthesis putative acetyltransferase n=1 Tax=Novosphingobium panipatense TaxID=428991 RepID=UPI0039A30916